MRNPESPWLENPKAHHCPPPHDFCAPDCDDQLPVFSRVGRGIKGDSLDAELYEDPDGHTHLRVTTTDPASGETVNAFDRVVDGGVLRYHYNLRPYNDPATFSITFDYDKANPETGERDEAKSWNWTTPAIPYTWTATDQGAIADDIVGSGVGSLFIKKTGESWETPTVTPHEEDDTQGIQEKLLYPDGWTRANFKAPNPTDPWTVNLSVGVGGDIPAVNDDDLAKILGVSPASLKALTDETQIPTDTFGPGVNVKEYIDALQDEVEDLKATIADLVGKIYNTTINLPNTGTSAITWGDGWNNAKIPEAHLNVFGGTNNPPSNKYADAIRSRPLANNDITFQ